LVLLLTAYNDLTLTFVNVEPTWSIAFELGVFGTLASIEEPTLGLFEVEMSFFKKTIMPTIAFNPFTWWVEHEYQFFNISHLAR
jgi:hypothetical protein